jgi:hypothetical protein
MSNTFWLSYGLLWALVVIQSLLLFALLREIGRIYIRQSDSVSRDGLSIGSVLPDIEVDAPRGRVSLPALLKEPYTLLLCALPDCPYCIPVVQAAERWSRHRANIGTLILVSGSERGEYDEFEGVEVASGRPEDIRKQLRVRASPFVFVVGSDAEVLSKGLANNHRDIRQLLASAGAFEHAGEEVVIDETSEAATAHARSS